MTESSYSKCPVFLQIANYLVRRGVPADAVDSQGATPLHYAACNHNLAFCRFLWGMVALCFFVNFLCYLQEKQCSIRRC